MSIRARGLLARYPGTDRPALRDVDFAADTGLHLVLGPTGAGKTTLLRVFAGALPPAAGEVWVAGANVRRSPLAARRHIGYVPQEIGLPHELTLREYLEELLALDGEPAEARGTRAQEAAAAVHLANVLDRRLRHFSGGMRRRALLAQALLRRPSVVLADEPSAGLDPEEQIAVRALLRDLGRNACVLVATHFVAEAAALGGTALLLREGAVLHRGPVAEWLEAARGRVWAVGPDVAPGPGRLLQPTADPRRLRLLGAPPPGAAAQALAPTLEDAYILAVSGVAVGPAATPPGAPAAPAAPPPPIHPAATWAPLQARATGQRAGGRWLLRDCTLDLGPGSTALVGPNGAGKTTLLRVLAGIRDAAAGRIWLDGRPARAEELRQAVAYVPQFPGVHPRLRARAHLERLAVWWGFPEPRTEARETMERLGLAPFADVVCAALDSGRRRRLALAEAWLRRCRVVLFDEPTADLDPEERAAFWTDLAALQADPSGPEAALVTTHLFDEVGSHCAWVAVLSDGRVPFSGSAPELAAQAAGRCFRLASPGLDPAAVPVDTREDGVAVFLPPEAAVPAGAEPRAPTPLDGYLAVLRGGGAVPAARSRRRDRRLRGAEPVAASAGDAP